MRVNEIYKLNKITGDPRFEGFALNPSPSLIGRETLEDDLTPGFSDAEETLNWKQPALANIWVAPSVRGRVSGFNDYPCINMIHPAFSGKAIDALYDILSENGEILPLLSETDTRFFFYNILTIASVLDRDSSVCEFWCNPPTTASDIKFFVFDEQKIQGLEIFRIPEMPMSVFVTNTFIDRVESSHLQGFEFNKVWPLAREVNWRLQKNQCENRREQLKKHTVVIFIPFIGAPDEEDRIMALEEVLDARLRVDSLQDHYLGSYEGYECVDDECRLFLSCPDSEKLLNYILEDIKNLQWRRPIRVCQRFGRMYELNTREIFSEI